jgi:hypothetical protein
MEAAVIRESLMKAINENNFLKVLNDYKFKDIRVKESAVIKELVYLHNKEIFDLNKQFLQLKKSSDQYNFYGLIYIYCAALPKLNCPVVDVINVYIYVKTEGIPVGDFEQTFFVFCKQNTDRSKVALDYLLEQSEKCYSLVANTIMAAAEFDSTWVISQLSALVQHPCSDIRWQAYMATGRVLLTDDETQKKRFELLDKASATDTDSSARAGIFRAAGFLAKQTPFLWPQVSLLFNKCLEELDPELLYEASYLLAYGKKDVPDNTIRSLLFYLKKASSNNGAILNNISYFISDEIEAKNFFIAEELLEELLLNNELTIDNFDSLAHELVSEKNSDFLNRITTKWFLTGELQLYKALKNVISDAGLKGKELFFDKSFLPLTESHLIFLARKVVGWLYFYPISALSYLLSILPHASSSIKRQIEQFIYDPLLLSYMGKSKRYVKEKLDCTDDEGIKISIQRLLSNLDDYCSDIRETKTVKELWPPQREADLYRKDTDTKMNEVMDKARKGSVMEFLSTQTILYGHDMVSHIHNGEQFQRSINTMSTVSHSTEISQMKILDPEGLDIMLRVFRTERFNDEADS